MLTGSALLRDPRYYKGQAFTQAEREKLNLEGLLPPRVLTQDEQAQRCFLILDSCHDDMEKYIYLQGLNARNRKLFFRVMNDRLVELMPIVYTPTVGKACQEFGHILRDSKGLYISLEMKGHIRQVLNNWPVDDIRGIVVTDGERILGLGDLGTFGMGIPIGKLQLYTACAGIDPELLFPITIDVGTNNETLLEDPLYTGLKQKRATGDEYDELIDEFVHAVKDRWGEDTLIQWEDFGNQNAFRLIEKYRDTCCTFNDDIQGTAAMTLAGILGSNRISGKKLADHIILIAGAGEAGLGIAELTAKAIAEEMDTSMEQARKKIFLVDSRGLLTKDRPSGGINEHKKVFAHDYKHIDNLAEAVREVKPSVLIGVTAKPGMFTEEIVKLMAANHDTPLIFPLSNPTSKSECTAQDTYEWTNGQCIFASGSPFEPVQLGGKTYVPGQGNNAYIFPGVALAVISTCSRRVTPRMMLLAAQALSESLTDDDLRAGRIFPQLQRIRSVSASIAAAVAQEIYHANLANLQPQPLNLLQFMMDQQYDTAYPLYAEESSDSHEKKQLTDDPAMFHRRSLSLQSSNRALAAGLGFHG